MPAPDVVYLRDLVVETSVGIYDWERAIRQRVVLQVDLGCDIRRAGAMDDIQYAIDYGAVAGRITQVVGEGRFGLIEALAEVVAALLLGEFAVAWVKVVVEKPGAVANARTVGVSIERRRSPSGDGR